MAARCPIQSLFIGSYCQQNCFVPSSRPVHGLWNPPNPPVLDPPKPWKGIIHGLGGYGFDPWDPWVVSLFSQDHRIQRPYWAPTQNPKKPRLWDPWPNAMLNFSQTQAVGSGGVPTSTAEGSRSSPAGTAVADGGSVAAWWCCKTSAFKLHGNDGCLLSSTAHASWYKACGHKDKAQERVPWEEHGSIRENRLISSWPINPFNPPNPYPSINPFHGWVEKSVRTVYTHPCTGLPSSRDLCSAPVNNSLWQQTKEIWMPT